MSYTYYGVYDYQGTYCNSYTPNPVSNRYSILSQDDDDQEVQDIGRLAAVTVCSGGNGNTSIMSLGSTRSKSGSKLVKLKVMGDSGAADCVLPASMFPDAPFSTQGPKVGRKYTAADGKHIYNMGLEH